MKLSKLIPKAIFFTALASTLFVFSINIFSAYNTFQNEKKEIKEEYLNIRKEEIKKEVLKTYNFINYQQSIIKDKLKKQLKERVNIAYNIANNIYNENKNKKTNDEIKYLIVTALKNIEFDKRSYYFINSNDGKAILFNKISKLDENKNIWNYQDKKGNYIIQEQSNIALTKNEGFLTTYFVKPDLTNKIQYPKLSYVKNFKPFNWHIGMGGYLDDLENKIKNEILEYIATIRFGDDGYIYVNRTDRKALVFDGKKLPFPKEYKNKKLFEKQLNILKKKDEGFFFFKFKKLNSVKKYPKLGFVIIYPKWNWIIGSGIYIDEVEYKIENKEKKLKQVLMNEAYTILVVFIILMIILFFISKRITLYIEANIKKLVQAFRKASLNSQEIKTKDLTFKEFKVIAKNLNNTLKLKNSAENKMNDYLKIINENVIISSTDTSGVITNVNDAFCKISGYEKDELIGKNHNIIRHEDMTKEFYSEVWDNLKNQTIWSGELKNRKKDGTTYWIKISIHPISENDKLAGYTAISEDITNRKKVEYLSITDELTKLYNRRFFNTKIEKELKRAKREDNYLSFLMIDIDYFKKYNDTYGHQKGDDILKKVSNVILSNIKRAGDFAFRLGGEEFGVIFTLKENPEKSIILAKRIKEEVENLQIEHKRSLVNKHLTISLGLVIKKAKNIKNSTELYKEADEALYKAKEQGRNCVCMNY